MILRTFALLLTSLLVSKAEKPNFVIVLGDDHGFYHSTVYGSPEFKTPNMQALADTTPFLPHPIRSKGAFKALPPKAIS